MNYEAHGRTDRGLCRDENEDALLCLPEHGVFAVADGIGGLPAGKEASHVAIDSIAGEAVNSAQGREWISAAGERANRAVYQRGQVISEDTGIGTTLTLVRIQENRLFAAHIGDSSLYLLREGTLTKLSKDHTLAQEALDRLGPGEEADIPDHFRHTLTRCLGLIPEIELDLFEHELIPGDRLLLCSDGVQKVFEDIELGQIMDAASSPEALVDQLIETGNERGGPDNITAIMILITAPKSDHSET